MLQIGELITLKSLLLVYLCSILTYSQIMYANISTSTTSAGASTQHFLTATFQNYTIPASAYLYLNYTAGWNVASITRASSGDFCENVCNISAVSITNSSNNIKITNFFPTALTAVNITIGLSLKNIINPPQAITDTISLSLYNSSGGPSLGSTTIDLTINPGIMTCVVTPTNKQIDANTSYSFTITPNPNIPLPSTGSLIMTLPSSWSDSEISPIFYNQNCTNVSGIVNCSVSGRDVTVINLFTGTTTSSFSFTFNKIINPGTQRTSNQITMVYQLANGNIASACSPTISGLTILSIPTMQFNIVGNKAQLFFLNPKTVMQYDQLVIDFPNEIYLGDVLSLFILINGSTTQLNVNTIKTYGLNQLILINIFSDTTRNYQNITISNIYVSLPYVTSYINFTIKRNGYPYATNTSCCNQTLSPNQTITASTSTTLQTMKSTADYQITFTLTYYSLNYFLLNFCSSFTLVTNQQYTCYLSLTLTNNLLNCTALSTSQLKVSLTNSSTFASVFGYQNNYTLIIVGINNPSVTSCSLIVRTYSSPSNNLQYSNSMNLTFVSTKIIQASLTLSNPVVGGTSNYTFKVNNTNVLPSNSQLYIYFPSSYNISGVSCLYDGGGSTICSNTSTTAVITIPAAMNQSDLASHNFTVLGVTNLYSFMPSSAFYLELQNNGSIIESVGDGIFAKLTTLANFSATPTITPSTLVAGQAASYTINFTHTLKIPSSRTINLSFAFPSSLFVSTCLSCSSYQTFTITNTTTSVTISQVYNPEAVIQSSPVVLSLYVDNYLSIQQSVSLPNYTATPLSFTVSSNNTYLGQAVSVNITINYLPLSTKYIVITIPIQYSIGSLNLYSEHITFSCTPSSNTLNLTVSSIFIVNTTINIEGLTNPNTSNSSAWILNTYTSAYILIGTGITVNKFAAVCGSNCRMCVNASYCTSCYTNSSISNYSLLDNGTCVLPPCSVKKFQKGNVCYACSNNCYNCSIFSQNCTSCNSPKLLLNFTCVGSCPNGYYANNGTTCLACTNNCQVCNTSTFCFSCVSGYVLLLSNNTCVLDCSSLPGYYNYSNECAVCPTNCLTCNEYGCLSCNGSNYLVQLASKVCLSSCPQNFYTSSTNSSICQICQPNCLTCQNNSHNCTSCNSSSNYTYLYNNQCRNSCPNTTYADQLNQCRPCVFPCLSCSSATNCTSCDNSNGTLYYFYAPEGQCTSDCFGLAGTVIIGSNCLNCTSGCLNCSGSQSTCTSCIQGYFFIRATNSCINSCSPPNIAYQGVCDQCLTPCTSCISANSSNPSKPGNITICNACVTGYRLYSSSCYSKCPSGTYANSSTECGSCSPTCFECDITASNCTKCYSQSFQYNNTCYTTCPPGTYINVDKCTGCQPQCLNCTTGRPAYECTACKNNTLYYYNNITYQCTLNCSYPYYANTAAPLACFPCLLPCKTCNIYYNSCASCYNGYYLLNQNCNTSCPINYYADSINNTCTACPNFCANCTSLSCQTCTSGNYFYAGSCYSTCPANAPYVYGIYCRNCLTDSCLVCNSDGMCSLCAAGTYNYIGNCVSTCPQNYEVDKLTLTRCVMVPAYAYSTYIEYLEVMKILVMPGSVLLLILILFIPFAEIKLFGLAVLLSVPQSIALMQFIIMYQRQQSTLDTKSLILPEWLGLVVIFLHLSITALHTIFLHYNTFSASKASKQVSKWFSYGSNISRYRIVMVCSLFNKQVIYLFFSGFFNLPITSLPFIKTLPRSFYATHIAYMFFQMLLVLVGVLVCAVKQTLTYNYKIFFSAVDLVAIFLISLIFDIVFLVIAKKQTAPTPYEKYVLPNVSNHTLPALSEPGEQIVEEIDPNITLHRSASDQDVFESKQMKDIDYKSVFDNNDYFDDTPFMENEQIKEAIEDGKFRKKNKKKRGRKRDGKLNVIEELSEEEQSEQQKPDPKKKGRAGDKKKTKKKKQNDVGLNNFIYWKKPKQAKKTPMKVFKQNQEVIMSRIKQKESEFETITQNDIIFLEQDIDNSSDGGYDIQNESRRALHRPQVPSYYDNLFNLNYAQRKHLK